VSRVCFEHVGLLSSELVFEAQVPLPRGEFVRCFIVVRDSFPTFACAPADHFTYGTPRLCPMLEIHILAAPALQQATHFFSETLPFDGRTVLNPPRLASACCLNNT